MNLKLIMTISEIQGEGKGRKSQELIYSSYETELKDGANLVKHFEEFLKIQTEHLEYVSEQKKKNPNATIEIKAEKKAFIQSDDFMLKASADDIHSEDYKKSIDLIEEIG